MSDKTPKQLWIEALRSGKYKQTRNALNDRTGFCCLGVACEVAIENGVPVIKEDSTNSSVVLYDGLMGNLSSQVSDWLDLDSQTQDYCVDLNDVHHKKFNEIADYLEQQA